MEVNVELKKPTKIAYKKMHDLVKGLNADEVGVSISGQNQFFGMDMGIFAKMHSFDRLLSNMSGKGAPTHIRQFLDSHSRTFKEYFNLEVTKRVK